MKFITNTILLSKEAQQQITQQPVQQNQQPVQQNQQPVQQNQQPVQQNQQTAYTSQQIMDWSKSLEPLFRRMIARTLSENNPQNVALLNKAVSGDVESRKWLMNAFQEFKSQQPVQQNQQQPDQQQSTINANAQAHYGDKLISLYMIESNEQVRAGRLKPENQKIILDQINNLVQSKKTLYSQLISATYQSLRGVDAGEYQGLVNSGKMPHDKNAGTYADTETASMESDKRAQGWCYRLPKNRNQMGWSTSHKSVERLSGAVIASVDLLKEMDNFASRHKAYYKVPMSVDAWLDRQDPLTVYFVEGCDPSAMSEASAILTKYSRTNYYDKSKLIGEEVAPGVTKQSSPNENEINNLIGQAKSIDSDFVEALKTFYTDTETGRLKASSGQIVAGENLIGKLR